MAYTTDGSPAVVAGEGHAGGDRLTRVGRPAHAGGLAMALICAAQFVLQLDFSIVNVALPTIQADLHMVAAELQWVVTGYALTFGSLLLVGGRLADLLGRRRVLVIGLIVFAVASLACGLAQWPVMLIVARLVQGSAAALVSPAALSLLTTTNAEGAARNRALAIWQATTAAGATAGIVAGGLLTQYAGWRAVFLVNPPLILIMLALIRRLPASAPTGTSRIDYPGAALVTAAIASLIFGLSYGQQHGFDSPATIATLVLAVLLGAAFVRVELTAAAPMLPLAIFSVPSRRAAVAAMVMIGAVLAGYVYFVSLYLQRVHHYSPVLTGLALVPSTVTVVLMSTLGTRRLLSRVSARWVLVAGLGCMGAGQLWLSFISVHATYLSVVLPGLILTSLGIGLALPTASIAITSGVRREDQGLAGALFTTSQQTGAAVGLAVLATAAAARTASAARVAGRSAQVAGSLVAGYRLSFLISTGIVVVAAILVTAQLRPRGAPQDAEVHQPSGGAVPAPVLAECQLRKC
jgi:EmrB/QacA subfamily drug resistance transporter